MNRADRDKSEIPARLNEFSRSGGRISKSETISKFESPNHDNSFGHSNIRIPLFSQGQDIRFQFYIPIESTFSNESIYFCERSWDRMVIIPKTSNCVDIWRFRWTFIILH